MEKIAQNRKEIVRSEREIEGVIETDIEFRGRMSDNVS